MESLQFQKASAPTRNGSAFCAPPRLGAPFFNWPARRYAPTAPNKPALKALNPRSRVDSLYGAGAALPVSVCASAVITIVTGLHLAIASIAVGFLVGRAVRIDRVIGRDAACRSLAVALTYLSITTSYVPLLIKEMRDNPQVKKEATTGCEQAKPALKFSPAEARQRKPKLLPFQDSCLR